VHECATAGRLLVEPVNTNRLLDVLLRLGHARIDQPLSGAASSACDRQAQATRPTARLTLRDGEPAGSETLSTVAAAQQRGVVQATDAGANETTTHNSFL
jgi:hypothetical protein